MEVAVLRGKHFTWIALLLMFLSVRLPAQSVSEQKVKVRCGVLQATLLRAGKRTANFLFRAEGHRWQCDMTLALFLKEGKQVSPISFHAGERVVLLSTYPDFAGIDIIADRVSYAAFCHDATFVGVLKNGSSGFSWLLSQAGLYRGKEPQDASLLSECRLQLAPDTQFWLQGHKRTRQGAQKYLANETKVFVAIRWRQYKDVNVLPAYAVFDRQTWRSYAQSELHTAKDLFTPRSPQYKRTKD